MQIDVDFDVFQCLTVLRRDEGDTCNDVIRRLLAVAEVEIAKGDMRDDVRLQPANVMTKLLKKNALSERDGAWIGNVFFPDGTQFRATYKGRTFRATIKIDQWIGEDGTARRSPSDAAGAISGTNVNGWRFWYGRRPDEEEWRRLDEFRP
jgi:hypothetical protein